LQNVCGFDLKPAGLRSYELKGSVAAEEAVLLVVKPDKAELVPLVKLPIAAKSGVGLVINIGGRIASLVANRENALANILAAVGSEEPPSILTTGPPKPTVVSRAITTGEPELTAMPLNTGKTGVASIPAVS
jgi:hypothetical protein